MAPLHDRGRVLANLAVAIADGATTIGGIPAAREAGRDLGEVIVVRLDATIVVTHSDRQQARGTFKGS